MGELKRYVVSVAGVQESKWFGKDVWPAADGYTFLHSGRPLPNSSGQQGMRVWEFSWIKKLLQLGERVVRSGR